MKKSLSYIVLFAVCCILFAGCDTAPAIPEGKTRVQIMLPGCYAVPVSERSAAPQTRAAEHPKLNPDMLELLDDGSTLWLAVYEKQADGSYGTKPSVLQSYMVRRSGNGYSSLYTCEVNPDGTVKSESDEPLYLEVGKTYKFRAVSPARELVDWEKMHVNNGDYLLATDDRYTQTEAKEMTIGESSTNSGVTYAYLNPLLHQTAQMTFTIAAGENVHRLEILPAGIEVSGLQDDIVNNNQYNWMTSDSLKMYLGNKHSRVTIKEFTTNEFGHITGKTAVLPTDAVSNSIIVLLNLAVNGINSQYTMVLTSMMLQPAYSYNFNITMKVENGVTVAVWQNQSWGWDMNLQ